MVGAGGFLGAVARFVMVRAVDSRLNQYFPYGTFAVNILGCFLIGVIAGAADRHPAGGDQIRLFLGTGFCGGFTTFSAFASENHLLLGDGLWSTGLLYTALSVVLGVGSVYLGHWCARFL